MSAKTPEQEELREKILELIDAWRFDADWQTSRAEDFPDHKGQGCGCGVCQKIHGLNSQVADGIMQVIEQEKQKSFMSGFKAAGGEVFGDAD